MAYRIRPCRSLDELGQAAGAIGHYFGWVPTGEEVERFSQVLPPERMHAAFDGKQIVGGAGVFPFEMTVPGGPVPCAGVTVVGVLPTHRRRGLLSRMMRAQIDDIHERGEPFAALWASEPTIYGRFGYGHASLTHEIPLPRIWAGLRAGTPSRIGQVRLVEQDEALKALPRLYQKVAKETPGFLSRSKAWWELRRLRDDPSRRPPGSGPLNRALLEIDGRAAGYALYRIVQSEKDGDWKRNLRVVEAVGIDPTATREIWRFLLEIDWTDEIQAWLLPNRPPVAAPGGAARPARPPSRHGTLGAARSTWARPCRRGATGRTAGSRSSVRDSFCAWNEGTWTLADGVAKRSSRRPDLRLGVQALGSAYLGGFSFAELSRAGLVEEAARGGLARADALFASERAPWCLEIF